MTDAAKRETDCVCGHAAHSGRLCLSEKCWCTVYVASRITPAPPHPAGDAGTERSVIGAIDFLERHVIEARRCCDDCEKAAQERVNAVRSLATAARQARDYPAMCRDGHAEVRYGYDPEGLALREQETCPVCAAKAEGRREGLEEAAKMAEQFQFDDGPTFTEQYNAAFRRSSLDYLQGAASAIRDLLRREEPPDAR